MQLSLVLKFFITVFIVVFFSVKLSDKTEWFENNTNLKGVIIGIILALATSLPELISGLTAIYINETELATASILGSNVFNFTIISVAFLTVLPQLPFKTVEKRTNSINLFLIAIYTFFILTYYLVVNEFFGIQNMGLSISSFFIVIAYAFSIYVLNKNSEDDVDVDVAPKNEILKNLGITFIFIVIIIYASTQLTTVAEEIMNISGLSASLIGSVLIGASTSLPEAVSAISLTKKKLLNIATASVIGSNLFNFLILAILDVFEKENIMLYISPSTFELVLIGLFFSILMYLSFMFIKSEKKIVHLITPFIVIGTYLFYLSH